MPGVANPAEIRRRACAEKTHSTRALDVEELETRDTTRERKSVNAPLRDGFVCAGVGLVVEDMNRAVPYLQEIDVTGDGATRLRQYVVRARCRAGPRVRRCPLQ